MGRECDKGERDREREREERKRDFGRREKASRKKKGNEIE